MKDLLPIPPVALAYWGLVACLPPDPSASRPSTQGSSAASSSAAVSNTRGKTSTANSPSGVSTSASTQSTQDPGFPWPEGIEPPPIPHDNPQTREKVQLGRHLFFDTRLSKHNNRSCAICHEAKKGYTDGFARSIGTSFEVHTRNASSLANVGYQRRLTWDRPEPMTLEAQVLMPLLGSSPVEMGIAGMEAQVLERLARDSYYQRQFPLAFPHEQAPLSISNIAKAIAAFERVLISRSAPFDRFLRGVPDALSPLAKRGYELFQSERLGCARCHSGPLLDRPLNASNQLEDLPGYFNIGLYNVQNGGTYPKQSQGLAARTGNPADDGKFRTPSLRNVALSHPYMHDGSVPTLDAVLEIYAAGGRVIQSEIPQQGDGRLHPAKSPLIKGFTMSSADKAALLAFLEALTDLTFITSPKLEDPWPQRARRPRLEQSAPAIPRL